MNFENENRKSMLHVTTFRRGGGGEEFCCIKHLDYSGMGNVQLALDDYEEMFYQDDDMVCTWMCGNSNGGCEIYITIYSDRLFDSIPEFLLMHFVMKDF